MKMFYENNKTNVDRTLSEGEELPYCGGITVVYTPGHTPGHICLYIKRYKILIAGDALQVQSGVLIQAPQSTNFDTDLSIESLKKITQYDVETVICYHGGIYQDNANKRLEELANG
jgi:glyoxylase-like metal-dependent hydrolase (beta-lactamase superfamily II)